MKVKTVDTYEVILPVGKQENRIFLEPANVNDIGSVFDLMKSDEGCDTRRDFFVEKR